MEAMSSVGQQLRQYYAEQLTAPLPEHLRTLLQQLGTIEQRSRNT
jgi:Anti-sigma factor NepR